MAKLTLTSTGTAAVYYSWVSQGRQRLPLAEAGAGGAQHSSEHAGPAAAAAAVAATATAAGHPQSYLFTMPDMQGVILPGESKTFRCDVQALPQALLSAACHVDRQAAQLLHTMCTI